MPILLLLLTTLSSQAVATGKKPRLQTAPASTASPAGAEAVRQFDDAVAAERVVYCTLPVAGGAGPNLAIRVDLEQAMRRAIVTVLAALPVADRGAASAVIWQRIGAVDAANIAYVKSILPADGWFRSRRDGAEVARNAWLIVQHSPDQAFQTMVVARMQPLVASGDAPTMPYSTTGPR